MDDGWDDDRDSDGRAPICGFCGVTALPAEGSDEHTRFVCENPDCDAFGEEI